MDNPSLELVRRGDPLWSPVHSLCFRLYDIVPDPTSHNVNIC